MKQNFVFFFFEFSRPATNTNFNVFQVQYCIATPEDVDRRTSKVQSAIKHGVPLVSEALVTDSVAAGAVPDDTLQYFLTQSASADSGSSESLGSSGGFGELTN